MARDFDNSVFINCPFDEEYQPILRAVLFCIQDLGFHPRIALERLDSGETRVEKIIELIRSSKLAVHDLSRLKSKKKGEFFRLNMPFELGLDIGCRRFKGGKWATKRCLILEAERYQYQAALSDLSNSDIAVHRNDALEALKQVRHWLADATPDRTHAGPTLIWNRFNDFNAANFAMLTDSGHSAADVDAQPISDIMRRARAWIAANPPTRKGIA